MTVLTPGPRVQIVQLPAETLDALAAGDFATANATSPVRLSRYLAGPDWRNVWRMRSDQVRRHPADAAWITGAVWDEDEKTTVGRAGFHSAPDAGGRVEIGYAVDPAHRRRGYARAALEALLARARNEPDVSIVRVTITPANVASSKLVAQYSFVAVGEQWDEQDGLEIVYEIPAA